MRLGCFLAFLLLAFVKGQQPENSTKLTPGSPLQGNVTNNEQNYFYVEIGNYTQALTIICTPLADGDPDLYVAFLEYPNSTTANYSARSYGQDAITVPVEDYQGKQYVYISVFGWRTASYTILASFESSVILIEGVPQGGQVPHEGTDYFEIHVPGIPQGEMTISATPLRGDIMVYISKNRNPEHDNPSTWQWSSSPHYQGEALIIHANDPNWPSDGTFYIGVYGVSNASYSIVASMANASVVLRDGIPQNDNCDTNQTEYFTISVNNPGCNLTVTVTPISGDPDLYISTTDPRPTRGKTNEWQSLAYGADSITISPASGTYYIGVYAWRNTTFTILGENKCGDENSTVSAPVLINGSPQQGILTQGEEQYYIFHGQAGFDLTISVTRRYGDPDIYVTNNKNGTAVKPTPQYYTWKSTAYGEDLLTISSTDPQYCDNCDYMIAVYAASNCSFTITAATGVTRLQEGVPFRNTLVKGQYEYFRFDVQALTKEITFTVTPLGQGDPDMFVSVTNLYPNATNSDWVAQRLYGDSITIPHTDPKACSFCTYWISIYSFSANTTFTLVASLNSTIRIQDGIPQSGHVLREQLVYYDFQSNGEQSVNIILTTLNGSTSLYVSSGDAYPEQNTYDWYAPYFNAIKTLTIDTTDEKACRNSSCYYRIGVFGIEEGDYTLVIQSYTTIILQSGVAQRFTVDAGEWEYFSIRVDESNKDLTIIATAITGDPDLYVSTTHEHPNSTEGFYDKKATRYGTDAVDYENANQTTYFIGVTAFATNSTFSIMAQITPYNASTCTDPSCAILLVEGNPQTGVVHQSRFVYYSFLVSSSEDVTFSLTKSYGDPDLYVSIWNGTGSFPNQTSKTWASTSVQSDLIQISNAVPGNYIIGVYAYQTSGYTLTASVESSVITLQNGVSYHGSGSARSYNYYMISVDTVEDLTVTVTPYSGDPDIYISKSPYPNKDNATWSAAAYRDDSITIPADDPNFCQCEFYIAIYSFSDSDYYLTASLSESQTLQNGIAQSGRVEVEAWKYYTLQIRSSHDYVTVTVTPQDGNPDLYVKVGTKPELNNFTWSVVNDLFTTSTLVIRPTDPNFCTADLCLYQIGVRGRTAANYTILATVGNTTVDPTNTTTTVELQNAIAVNDWVDTNSYKYYSFGVNSPNQDVTIIVTPLSGDPDLYVSTSNPRPTTTAGTYNWSSRAVGGDAVAITNSTAPIRYFIAVYAFSNSSYTITAYVQGQNSLPVTLVNGFPQNGVVNTGTYQLYKFFLTSSVPKVTVSLTRTLGDPDVYIRNDGQMPNRTSFTWSSTSFGQDLIVITNPTPGEYDVAVFGYSTSEYQILFATSNGCTTLSDGVPSKEALNQSQFEYFCFTVDRADSDLTVSVTSFNGDPDLYISSTNPTPNQTTAEWMARSPREDSITIPFSELRLQTYYIGVQAWTNCTFTIIASLDAEILLQAGSPQTGTVKWEASTYYRFRVGVNVTDITFTLTPLVGTAFLYVSTGSAPDKSRNDYDWLSIDTTTGQEIKIYNTDPKFCQDCIYYVEVYGNSDCNYTIVAVQNIGGTGVSLQNGVPFRATVGTGEYVYLSFDVVLDQAALSISVTPISGDPDLYVNPGDDLPTTTNYTWRAVAYGADTINIDYTDPKYKVGRYTIGVYAWRNSTFTVTAMMIPITSDMTCNDQHCPAITLANGVPQVGFLNATGNALYYEFFVGSKRQTVTFTVTPRYGDPDMYIRSDGQRPNSTFFQWSARSYGRDSISIDDGCVNCRYMIDIEAYTHTLFSIVATTNDTITLLENGVPIITSVDEHEFKYYYVLVGDSENPLIISATAISGDPDLFISNTTQYPNATTATWKVQAYGSDQFVLNSPAVGTYYIGAYAYHNASFTIVATNGPITLVNGEPHNDQLDRGQYRDYQLIVNDPNHSDLTISLNVNQGDPVMYVGNNPSARPDPNNPSTYRWATAVAANTAQRYIITVPSNTTGACYNCTYFIRVNANTSYSTFSITATYGATQSIVLLAGTPHSSTVRAGEYVYFRGLVDEVQDLNIGVTTFTGDTDLIVGTTTPVPTLTRPETYHWSSEHDPSARGDYVYISQAPIGPYYIGVYGYEDSKFTITLSTNATLLPAGIAQVGIIGPEGVSYFFLDVATQTDVILSLSTFNSSQTPESYTVYVTTNSSIPQPNEGNYYWKTTLTENGDSFFISRDDARACSSCTYYIGLKGTVSRHFTIAASTETTPDTLFSGKPFKASVSNEGLKYFQIFVPRADDVTVIVETCSGNADLYISQDSYKPSPTQFRYSATNDDKNDIVPIKDGTIVSSEFYIGVYGKAPGISDYIITAWTETLPPTAPSVNAGVILAKPHEDSIELQFNPASSATYASDTLKYTVYYAFADSPIVMYSACGISKASNLPSFIYSKSQTGAIVVSVKGLLRNRSYKFNVAVADPEGQTTLYTPTVATTADLPPSEDIPIVYILGIGIPVGALILVFVIYLIVRNRKLTKELEIEMHDIPKSAVRKAVAGPPSARGGKDSQRQPYNRLLQQDEDDEESGDYAGPDDPISVAS